MTDDTMAALIERARVPASAPIGPLLKKAGVTWHTTRPLEQAGNTTFGGLAKLADEATP